MIYTPEEEDPLETRLAQSVAPEHDLSLARRRMLCSFIVVFSASFCFAANGISKIAYALFIKNPS